MMFSITQCKYYSNRQLLAFFIKMEKLANNFFYWVDFKTCQSKGRPSDDYPRDRSKRRSGQIYFVGSDNPVPRVYRWEERGSIALLSTPRRTRTTANSRSWSSYRCQFLNGLVFFHAAAEMGNRRSFTSS